MKKKWILIVLTLCVAICSLFAVACKKKVDSTSDSQPHSHSLQKVYASTATCVKEGKKAHFYCDGCGKYFSDMMAQSELSYDEVFTAKTAHSPERIEATDATCKKSGNLEYYTCTACGQFFADASCETPREKEEFVLAKKNHTLSHVAQNPVNGSENGVKEHWRCSSCEGYFADENGQEEIVEEDVILYSILNVPDFIVEVPEGRDPVILQLSDTQIIDAGQERAGRGGIDREFWATDMIEERCYDYVSEIITATNPDFIILTGDIIYGEFDDNGTVLTSFINFMESFQIPWAPIFGNHDNESKKGVDWQCEQFENATYCLFEQKTLSGNGNYSVGIVQGGELKRVFYMMDTHACGNASEESLANGHTYNNFVGFKNDQIEWYTKQINVIKELSPSTKISFAYHIQQYVFGDALEKYGFDQTKDTQNINLYTRKDTAEGDFGYVGAKMKGPWDYGNVVFDGMKALGVDSIFVGHVHENSASVMYEGIRLQFGQKSSEYDRYNYVDANGQVASVFGKTPTNCTPLIGGSVIVLDEEDGSICDSYIYYCKNAGGNINWEDFIEYEVEGLQKGTDLYSESSAVSLTSVKFSDTINAYKMYANTQGKVMINPELLRGKRTFTFTIYVSSGYSNLAGAGPFAIRVKPDNGAIENIAGGYIDVTGGNKQYILFEEDSVEETRIVCDTWQTFTVDVSSIESTCMEFSFLIAQGNTVYIRNITIA